MKSARQHVVFSSTPSSLSRGHPSFPPSFPPSCITQIRGCAATRSKSVTSIERALSEGKRFKSSERKEMVCVNTQGAPLHPAVQKSAGLDRIRYTASYSFETAIHHAVRLLLSTSIIGWIVSSLKVNWCLSARGQGGAEHGAVCEGPLCCSEGVTAADQSECREPRQRWHLRIRRILFLPSHL